LAEGDLAYQGPEEDIEDDEVVQVSYERAPLTMQEKTSCIHGGAVPPWRAKQDKTKVVKERSWDKPAWMTRKGTEAKQTSRAKLKEKQRAKKSLC